MFSSNGSVLAAEKNKKEEVSARPNSIDRGIDMKLQNLNKQLAVSKALLGLPMHTMPSPQSIALAIFFFFSLVSHSSAAAANDPLEMVNRGTHSFNQLVDKTVVKPLAGVYDKLTPRFVKVGVSNFFNNLDDVRVGVNHLAQLDMSNAANDFGRLIINSTVGVGGLIDVADSEFGLEKNRQDFGRTLAHYGVESGPYLVLPFFGPSTARDAFGLAFDSVVEPLRQVDHVPTRNSLAATETVDFRNKLSVFDNLVMGDSYLFLREAYLQRREFLVNDRVPSLALEDF